LWDLLLEALNETEGVGESVQMIDGAIIRAHQSAAGAKGGLRVRVLGAREVASRLKFTSARTAKACRSPQRSPQAKSRIIRASTP
jgi:hypothetical protein